VSDGVGADFVGDLDQAFRDQGTRDRRAEQILPLVHRIGAEHRKHEVTHEFLAHVLDVDVAGLDAEQFRLGASRFEFLALAEVGGEGHHLAAVGGLQPFQDDRGVEAPGIGEDDLFDFLLGAGHGGSRGREGSSARLNRRPASAQP